MWNKTKSLNNKILWEDKQFVLFLIIGVVKNRHFSTEGIFTQKKIILQYLKKPKQFQLLLV